MRIRKFLKSHQFLISSTFLMLILINIMFSYIANSPVRALLFTSDSLYLPTLFSDVFLKKGQLKDWYLTPAPYFVPDYLIYYISYIIGISSYFQIVIFSLIQTTLLFAAIWLLASLYLGINSIIVTCSVLCILIWLALKPVSAYIFMLSSGYHFGAFVMSIMLYALYVKSREDGCGKRKIRIIIAVALLSYSVTLSDRIFFIQCIFPLFALQILQWITKSNGSRQFSKLEMAIPIISSFLGYVSYNIVVNFKTNNHMAVGADRFFLTSNAIGDVFSALIQSYPALGILFIIYIGVIAYSIFRLSKCDDEISWFIIFSFLSNLASVIAIVFMRDLPFNERYIIPLFFWPIIAVFIWGAKYMGGFINKVAISISMLALMSIGLESYQLISINGIDNKHYPNELSCLDDALAKEGLNIGVAQYWDAKYIQNFSRLNLTIAQYQANLAEHRWITSAKYYNDKYDFAIMLNKNNPDQIIFEKNIRHINGEPMAIISCGNAQLIMYGSKKLSVDLNK